MKVRQVVAGGVGGDGAAGGLAELRAGRLAELAGIGLQSVHRIDVHHFGVNDAAFRRRT